VCRVFSEADCNLFKTQPIIRFFSQPVQGEESCPRLRATVGLRRTNIFSLASRLVEPNLRAVPSDEADRSTEHIHLCFCYTLHLSWYHHRRSSDRAGRRGLEDECIARDSIAYVQWPRSIPEVASSRPGIYIKPGCRNMEREDDLESGCGRLR
jgi:hypothetical protein